VGQIVNFLNEQKGEPYRGVIWPDDCDYSAFNIEDDLEELEMVDAHDVMPESPTNGNRHSSWSIPPLFQPELLQSAPPVEEPKAAKPSPRLRYPELRFPYEAVPDGQFKKLVDKACEGGLSGGLVVPALLSLASSVPFQDKMEGARINLYVCLLALVGAGKDTAIDRSTEVLGINDGDGTCRWYAPSGERSMSFLLGDTPPNKSNPERKPGPKRQIFVSYELDDTISKSRGETSGVLPALQWYYDHNTRDYGDAQKRTLQHVDCRLSWLTALPVGETEIDPDEFRAAFGESSTKGTVSRLLFGFAEEKFDRRRSRNWSVEHNFHSWSESKTEMLEGVGPVTTDTYDSILSRLRNARVEGFASGVEEQYLNWHLDKDYSGRDGYHALKVSILCALLSEHKLIEQSDWDFATAFMEWQGAIRREFTTGKSKKMTQGEFNEKVIKALCKEALKRRVSGKDTANVQMEKNKGGQELYFMRWRKIANNGKWWRSGLDTEKTINQLVRGGILGFLKEEEDSPQSRDPEEKGAWVRVINLDQTAGSF